MTGLTKALSLEGRDYGLSSRTNRYWKRSNTINCSDAEVLQPNGDISPEAMDAADVLDNRNDGRVAFGRQHPANDHNGQRHALYRRG